MTRASPFRRISLCAQSAQKDGSVISVNPSQRNQEPAYVIARGVGVANVRVADDGGFCSFTIWIVIIRSAACARFDNFVITEMSPAQRRGRRSSTACDFCRRRKVRPYLTESRPVDNSPDANMPHVSWVATMRSPNANTAKLVMSRVHSPREPSQQGRWLLQPPAVGITFF